MEMIENKNGLAKMNEPCKSIDVRRNLAGDNELISKLSPIDRDILLASTRTCISEMGDKEIVDKLSIIADIIRRDIGIKNIDTYEITRFCEILKTYYSSLTLSEVKMAFELSMTGKLDEYLPKDRYGNPDNNHYQSFSALYVTKILNAYIKRKSDAEFNVRKNVKVEHEVSHAQKDYYAKACNNKLYIEFLRYKYTGKINWSDVNDFLIYQKLTEIGYDEPVKVTQEDMEQAVKRLLMKGQKGVINKFVTDCVRALQTKHQDVPGEAFFIARRKAIIRSFDNMIKNEIQF